MVSESLVKEIVKQNLLIKSSISSSDSSIITHRKLQHFLSLKFSDPMIQSTYENVLNHASICEISCPGSGLYFLQKYVDPQFIVPKSASKPKDKFELLELIKREDYKGIINDVLKQVVDLCNKDSKISIKPTDKNITHVELTEGHTFDLKPLIRENQNMNLCKMICIDGYIESVSEIHHILQSASDSRDSLLLFARGAADDVVHTIKVNNKNGRFRIIPIQVNFDIEHSNTLVDLSIVSGNDLVSSLKGQTMSSIDLENFTRIDSAIIRGNKVIIKNERTRGQVLLQINRLKNQILERPEISEILSKRISSLTSNYIDIHVAKGIDQRSNMQQLDEGIRIISSVIQNKYDPIRTVDEILKSYYDNCFNSFTICNQ